MYCNGNKDSLCIVHSESIKKADVIQLANEQQPKEELCNKLDGAVCSCAKSVPSNFHQVLEQSNEKTHGLHVFIRQMFLQNWAFSLEMPRPALCTFTSYTACIKHTHRKRLQRIWVCLDQRTISLYKQEMPQGFDFYWLIFNHLCPASFYCTALHWEQYEVLCPTWNSDSSLFSHA